MSSTPVIVVLGPAGSGKTSLINALTASDISNKIKAFAPIETQSFSSHLILHESVPFLLVDTPSFDGDDYDIVEVLSLFTTWLQQTGSRGRHLAGVVLLHPISQPRLKGSAKRSMERLGQLLELNMDNQVLLVTTFWNEVDEAVGGRREAELGHVEGTWRSLLSHGCRVERVSRDYVKLMPFLAQMANPASSQLAPQTTGERADCTATILDLTHLSITSSLNYEEGDPANSPDSPTTSDAAVYRDKLQELVQRQERDRKAAKQRIEEHAQEASLQAAEQKQWMEVNEARTVTLKLESLATHRHSASLIQQKSTQTAVQWIAAYLARQATSLMFADLRQHQDASYSITPTALSQWCDACRYPIGARLRYVCQECNLEVCSSCFEQGRGCKDRDHVLRCDDNFIQSALAPCRRALHPEAEVRCDSQGCGKILTGLYCHCCSLFLDDYDLCLTCALTLPKESWNAEHAIRLAVAPMAIAKVDSLMDPTVTQAVGKHQAVQTYCPTPAVSSWMASLRMLRVVIDQSAIASMASRTGFMLLANPSEISVPFCDACHFPWYGSKHYSCRICAGGRFALCADCVEGGNATCLDPGHLLEAFAPTLLVCSRRRYRSRNAIPTCDITGCGKRVKYHYLHCCLCRDDNFDMCWDCAVAGQRCDVSTHKHTLLLMPPPEAEIAWQPL